MPKLNMSVERLIDDLILIGDEQAKLLSLPAAERSELSKTIVWLLLERGSYECVIKGIITKKEFANLILAHFQTCICKCARVREPAILPDYSGLYDRVVGLLEVI